MVEVKFCGLTREEDAACAGALSAGYAGVIFAGGPRELAPDRALSLHLAAGANVKRVGVFGADFRTRIGRVTEVDALDVVQLHADPSVADVRDARRLFAGEVWAAVRIERDAIPIVAEALFAEADAVLLDARVPGKLGGAGVALPWRQIAMEIERIRRGHRLVLAGGLRPDNVAEAVEALLPQIVDVSSGVESAPGIKDQSKMQAFSRAVHGRSE